MESKTHSQEYIYEKLMPRLTGMYNRLAENPNLSPGQHDLLAELSAVRHYIHAKPDQMYFGSMMKDMIDEYFIDLANGEIFGDSGLDFPYEIIKQFSSLETYQKYKNTPGMDIRDHIRMFAEEHENINKSIETYLRRIDREYGTNYCPRGVRRDPSIDCQQRSQEKVERIYETKEKEVFDGVSIQQLESRCVNHIKDAVRARSLGYDVPFKAKYLGTVAHGGKETAFVDVNTDKRYAPILADILKNGLDAGGGAVDFRIRYPGSENGLDVSPGAGQEDSPYPDISDIFPEMR